MRASAISVGRKGNVEGLKSYRARIEVILMSVHHTQTCRQAPGAHFLFTFFFFTEYLICAGFAKKKKKKAEIGEGLVLYSK